MKDPTPGPAIPAMIGRYRILDIIGRGATSVVYRGVDDELAVDVAVKVMSDHLAVRPELRSGVLREGRALRRVTDPHVLTVHDVGTLADDRPYLVVEHIDGGSLEDRLAVRSGPASHADVIELARQLAAGLSALHNAGIVHGDVKPDNLLVDTGGHPDLLDAPELVPGSIRLVLADGGIATEVDTPASGGTADYESPEQRAGDPVDATTDLHAATVIVARALTGAPAWDASALLKGAVDTWARRATSVDISRRATTADEWLGELVASLAADDDAIDAHDATIGTRRRLSIAMGASAALILIIALVVGFVLGQDEHATASTLEARPDRHQVVRVVGGSETVVAGNGNDGDSGDGGAALSASLIEPVAAVQNPAGDVLIADAGAHRIRRVTPDGTITTLAGTGRSGIGGEGAAAAMSALNAPGGLAVAADGVIYVSDTGNHRIRRISDGVITTIAGTGTPGRAGAGGPATAAQLDRPTTITLENPTASNDAAVLIVTDHAGTIHIGPDGVLLR